MSESFDTAQYDIQNVTDNAMDLERKKKFRLLTIHERLGHISFSVLKLMARCYIIPRELATVDPPFYPGCAYGNSHRKPSRCKGVKNVKALKTTTTPGHYISVDQLVSPTPGFVPTHRYRPTLQ